MSNTETRLLQVGDMIYNRYGKALGNRKVIDRVTTRRAYAGSTVFIREVRGKWLNEYGGGRGYAPCYALATPELDAEWMDTHARCRAHLILTTLAKQALGALTSEQITALLEALAPFTPNRQS